MGDWLGSSQAEGLLDRVPAKAAEILGSAQVLVEHRQRQILWELDRVAWALADTEIQPVALKGGPPTCLRIFPWHEAASSRMSTLWCRARGSRECEAAILARGWLEPETEQLRSALLPGVDARAAPLRHGEREIEVDLHHTILPLTSRLTPPVDILFASATEIPDTGYRVLSPPDMVLHSATHLFHDGQIKSAGCAILSTLAIC